MSNPSFIRSLTALAHPLTLAAVLLLLANDHVFKALWPGWVTGKLGDVVGLAFLPLLLAVPLSIIVPGRVVARDRWVMGTAIGASGVWWALAVTAPEVHAASLAVLSVLTASDFYWERDPSDLVALPGLWGAWYAWEASAPAAARSQLRGVAVGALALVACVATSSPGTPQLDYGVRCVSATDDRLLAVVGVRSLFESHDGGLTWLVGESEGGPIGDECIGLEVLGGGSQPGHRYRIVQKVRVERSNDAGASWQTDLDLIPLVGERREALVREVIRADERRTRPPVTPVGTVWVQLAFRERPLAAAMHQGTGNVILAMGHEGVLVRTADGSWRWVSVGSAHYRGELTAPIGSRVPEWMLSVTLLPLLVFVVSRGFRRPAWEWVAWLLGLGLWLVAFTGVSSAREGFDTLSRPMFQPWHTLLCALSLSLSLLPSVSATQTLRGPKGRWMAVGMSSAATAAFYVPLELWHLESMTGYSFAISVGTIVSAAICALGVWLVLRTERGVAQASNGVSPGEAVESD